MNLDSKEPVAEPVIEPRDWPRIAARASNAAAYICFALNCTLNQLTAKTPASKDSAASTFVGWLSTTIVVMGIGLAAYAMLTARTKRRETVSIAMLGLLLNVGIIALVVWGLWLLRAARAS